jgi:hypothetical protein
MIKLKNSFKRSFATLPRTFSIEDPSYLPNIGKVALAFTVFAGVILFFIFLYIILRFCFNKCIGPVKMNQITRAYRNVTWFLLSKYFII